MDPLSIVAALMELVLKLVDRGTAKTVLDQTAVRLANLAADEIERQRFGPVVAPDLG